MRSRNSRSGMTGSATRSSTTAASPSSSTPPATHAVVLADSQSKLCPASDTQTSRTLTPPVSSAAPR